MALWLYTQHFIPTDTASASATGTATVTAFGATAVIHIRFYTPVFCFRVSHFTIIIHWRVLQLQILVTKVLFYRPAGYKIFYTWPTRTRNITHKEKQNSTQKSIKYFKLMAIVIITIKLFYHDFNSRFWRIEPINTPAYYYHTKYQLEDIYLSVLCISSSRLLGEAYKITTTTSSLTTFTQRVKHHWYLAIALHVYLLHILLSYHQQPLLQPTTANVVGCYSRYRVKMESRAVQCIKRK